MSKLKRWDPIFKAGSHTAMNGVTRNWTREDLDQLVNNSGEGMPIVIHHPEDEGEAVKFGKIAGLRRIGDDLEAQYRDVPEILSMAVEQGLKLAKSVAIDPAKMEIRHVGLLGANQPPAVDGLGPARFAKDKEGEDSLLTYMQTHFEKEDPVDPKDEKIKKLEDEITALKAGNETEKLKLDLEHAQKALKDEENAHTATKAEFAKFKSDQEADALEARVDALAQSGRIRPGEKKKVLGFAKAMDNKDATMEFAAADGKTVKVTPQENYLRDLEARTENRDGLLNEFAKDNPGNGAAAGDDDWDKDINNYA